MKKICIIDYGLGNLASIYNAVKNINHKVVVSKNENDIFNSSHLILPGVGSFKRGMDGLKNNNLIDILTNQVLDKKKPFLGICLGMQLLLSRGMEDGNHKGLDWIDGKVSKLKSDSKNIKIPHMGWNEVNCLKKNNLFKGIADKSSFYFVHSYQVLPKDISIVSSTCSHGINFIASIEKENIFSTQFHPEKSHDVGNKILKNFIDFKC